MIRQPNTGGSERNCLQEGAPMGTPRIIPEANPRALEHSLDPPPSVRVRPQPLVLMQAPRATSALVALGCRQHSEFVNNRKRLPGSFWKESYSGSRADLGESQFFKTVCGPQFFKTVCDVGQTAQPLTFRLLPCATRKPVSISATRDLSVMPGRVRRLAAQCIELSGGPW